MCRPVKQWSPLLFSCLAVRWNISLVLYTSNQMEIIVHLFIHDFLNKIIILLLSGDSSYSMSRVFKWMSSSFPCSARFLSGRANAGCKQLPPRDAGPRQHPSITRRRRHLGRRIAVSLRPSAIHTSILARYQIPAIGVHAPSAVGGALARSAPRRALISRSPQSLPDVLPTPIHDGAIGGRRPATRGRRPTAHGSS